MCYIAFLIKQTCIYIWINPICDKTVHLIHFVHMICGSCTGGMCHFSCAMYVVFCCECYLFCRTMDYGLMENDFVCLTSDSLTTNISMKPLHFVFCNTYVHKICNSAIYSFYYAFVISLFGIVQLLINFETCRGFLLSR